MLQRRCICRDSSFSIRNRSWSVCKCLFLFHRNVYNDLFDFNSVHSSIRGVLGSTFILSANFGILFAFIIGNYFNFYMFPKVVIAIIIVYTVAFFFIPESPAFLMKQKKISVSTTLPCWVLKWAPTKIMWNILPSVAARCYPYVFRILCLFHS